MEPDDRDREAVHIRPKDAGEGQAFLRIMDRGLKSGHVSVGRVDAVKRRSDIGSRRLKEGIRAGCEALRAETVCPEVQGYAVSFYGRQVFWAGPG